MTGPDVLALLARLEADGVRLALNESGNGLRVYGEGRPRPEVMAEVKAHKPALLAHFQGAGQSGEEKDPALSSSPEVVEGAARAPVQLDPAPWEDGPQVVANCDNLEEAADVQTVALCPPAPDSGPARRPAAHLPDWQAISAQAGRCGSCSRAQDASEEWGPLMVRCLAPEVAWWPSGPPLALHVGAVCGAYLRPGEEVGAGYRSKEAAKTWGSGQARRVPVPDRGASL